MPTSEYEKQKEYFSLNLTFFMEAANISQTDLAKYVGVSTATTSDWCNGKKMPRMDKIVKMCQLLGVKKSDLLEDHTDQFYGQPEYYIDDETKAYAEEIKNSPGRRALLDAVKGLKEVDMIRYAEFIKGLTNDDNKAN